MAASASGGCSNLCKVPHVGELSSQGPLELGRGGGGLQNFLLEVILVVAVPQKKIRIELPCDPTALLLGLCSEELGSGETLARCPHSCVCES